ncbi:hypothetical protein [Microbacterium suaedae]|uniref:hypothetical protein n=1 Tax=Microbacterium suaedae TaxID=2067813 RepID=UPI000DA25DAA|nr:hypothetical protein [Microbacterium suaedae]
MTWIRESVRTIRLGGWAVEMRDEDLAGISYRGREVLRSVRAVVRDRDWSTAEWTVDGVEVGAPRAEVLTPRPDGPPLPRGSVRREAAPREAVGTEESGESVSISAQPQALSEARVALSSTSFDVDLRALLTIRARGSKLSIALEVTASGAFLTNRTGLVVLHPPSLAGAPLEVVHSSGEVERTSFPTAISPHQPAFDIVGLSWEDVRVDLDGDTFEMEDQRNWTDASYKTYSRPLSLPFPYELAAGDPVRQTVTVTVDPVRGATGSRAPKGPSVHRKAPARLGAADSRDTVGASTEVPPLDEWTAAGEMPAVSVGASTAPGAGPASEPIGSELLVELDLGWAGWPAALARAAEGGATLDVRLVLPENDAETRVTEAVRALAAHRVVRIAAFQPAGHEAQHVSDEKATRILRAALERSGLRVPIVGGARSHFTELNREHHRLPHDLDGLVFSTTPLFHTLETRQLEEAVAMQRLVAEQAVRIARGKPVHIGPVTLRTHVNNVATTPPPRPAARDLSAGYGPELLDADDERQTSPELAAWTIASAAALTVPGVESLSFYEAWGPRGIRAADGDEFPVAAALRALAALDGPVTTAHTPDGKVWAIRSSQTTLFANLDAVERVVGGTRVAPRGWQRIGTHGTPTIGRKR